MSELDEITQLKRLGLRKVALDGVAFLGKILDAVEAAIAPVAAIGERDVRTPGIKGATDRPVTPD